MPKKRRDNNIPVPPEKPTAGDLPRAPKMPLTTREERYRKYVSWMATPDSDRVKIKNINMFIVAFGSSPEEIAEFNSNPNFSDDLNAALIQWAKKKTPEMIHMLYERYKESKNPQDLRIWQDAIESYDRKDRPSTVDEMIAAFQPTDAQMVEIARRIISKKGNGHAAGGQAPQEHLAVEIPLTEIADAS